MPGVPLSALCILIHLIILATYEAGRILFPLFQMKNGGLDKLKKLAQGHWGCPGERWHSSLGSVVPGLGPPPTYPRLWTKQPVFSPHSLIAAQGVSLRLRQRTAGATGMSGSPPCPPCPWSQCASCTSPLLWMELLYLLCESVLDGNSLCLCGPTPAL